MRPSSELGAIVAPDGGDPESERIARFVQDLLVVAAAVFVLMGTYGRSGADPAYSRLATVYSLTEYGTFYIDRPADESPILFEERTIDKVMVGGERVGEAVRGGRIISSKPPVLPLLMTGEYWVMNRLFGWHLDTPEDVTIILYWMTVTLVGAAYVLGIYVFARTLAVLGADPFSRIVLTCAFALCTQLWGFSTLLNNHVPATAMALVAVYQTLRILVGGAAPKPWRLALIGLTSGLTLAIDLPATVFPGLAALALLYRHPRETVLWGGLGAAGPLLVHFGITYAVTGSVLPVQSRPELYLYEGAYWRHPRATDALNEPKLTYLFHMTLGRRGLFSLFPILFIGVAAGLRAVVRRDTAHRHAILMGFLGFLVLNGYYLAKTDNYGGECYGFRWAIVSMPMLLLMGLPLMDSLKRGWRRAFLLFVLAVSFYSAWEGTRTAWRASQEWTCRFLGPVC